MAHLQRSFTRSWFAVVPLLSCIVLALATDEAGAANPVAGAGAIDKKGAAIATKDSGWKTRVAALHVGWHYSWGPKLPEDEEQGVEFVPMIWGCQSVNERFRGYVASALPASGNHSPSTLLGFNEPDNATQSNMTVEHALTGWPELMKTGMRLGSPAAVHADGPWMQEFMAKAKERDYRVDFVCVHAYPGPNAKKFLADIQRIHDLYGKPIWITEFAVADWKAKTVKENRHSPQKVLAFMREVLPALDKLDYVERYAWFSGSIDSPELTCSALFNKDGELTELGKAYAGHRTTVSSPKTAEPAAEPARPNIILVLSDDIAQGDLGCYGQKLIQTPHLDRMAAEGTRFMQAYCGTSVCAPSRTSLMIGRHMGHSPIRANREAKPEGQMPLPAGTLTVAKVLKDVGYATACAGKWGMGMFDTTGSPLKVGFDHFYGYNCQRHAHSYFPTYLYKNDQRFALPGNDGQTKTTYSDHLIQADVLEWIREHKNEPFFFFYASTLPHDKHEIDDLGIYKDKPWPEKAKTYAAMVTRLDSDMGELFALLEELKIDDNTIVFFLGDNGSSFSPTTPVGELFDQTMSGKLRGFKRGMYEGALRQAALVRWPGKVPAGRVTEEPWAFWDFLPTAAALAGAKIPSDAQIDGVSLVPFLGGAAAPKREYFYWELHEGKPIQAVRFGDWKAVRNGVNAPIELYDLSRDVGEKHDLASENPDLVAQATKYMEQARVDDPNWPMR
jgi:arylsulfatase A-like enzyme